MSLGSLLGLASTKAVAAVAGVTLTVGGAAGVVVAADHAPDDTPAVVVEQVDPQVEPADEQEGPNENAADVAHDIWEFRSTTDLTGCEFGLGVAAIASKGKAPAADDVCNRDGGAEGEELGSQGEGAASAGADNADRAEGHLADADEAAADEARIPADVPVGDADAADDRPDQDDAPRGGPGTGEDARGNAGPPSDG